MAFTVRDAIATWDTQGALKSYLSGFQTQDSSNRDWERIAQTTIAQAENKKANDFNRMFSQMKYHDQQDQQQIENQFRQQELLIRQEQYNRQQELISQGINPRTGVPVSQPSASSTTIWPPEVDVPEMSGMGEMVESDSQVLQEGDPVTEMSTETAPTLFPTDGEGREIPPMSGPTGQPEDDAPAAAPSEPLTFTRMGDATIETINSIDTQGNKILQQMMAEEGRLQQQLRQANSMSLRRSMDPYAQMAWADRAVELQAQQESVKSEIEAHKRDQGLYRERVEPVRQRAQIMKQLAPLDGVLPEKDVDRIAADALKPDASPKAVERLKVLQEYQTLRQDEGWTHKSTSVSTAENLVEAHRRLDTPRMAENRINAEEYDNADVAIKELTAERSEASGSRLTDIDDEIADLKHRKSALATSAQTFRAAAQVYDRALKADVKPTPKSAREKPVDAQTQIQGRALVDSVEGFLGGSSPEAPLSAPGEIQTISRGAAKYYGR